MKKFYIIIISYFLLFNLFHENPIVACNRNTSCNLQNDCNIDCGTSKPCSGSKSFFRPRSLMEDVVFFNGLNEYYYHRKYFEPDNIKRDEAPRIHIARGVVFEKSRNNSKHNVGKYFLPNNKNAVSVRENGSGDLGSLWFKVIAPDSLAYESTITFCPERSVFGGYFNYRQDFDCIGGLWLEAQMALYRVEHRLHAVEKVTNRNALGTIRGASTVLEYLSNNDLKYGKIKNCLEHPNFDDIQLKLGYDFFACPEKGYYLGVYGSALIPTADKPTAEYLFEPLVGRGHWGLGVGLNAGYNAYSCENHSLAFLGDFSYQHLFKGTELRSFDFKRQGQWSRYLRLARRDSPAVSFPAINLTTLPVKVEPRGVANLWVAAHYQFCSMHFEVGYNLWWRQAEKVCLKRNKCPIRDPFAGGNVGIFGMGNVCTPTTASTANISQGKTFTGTGNVVVNDATFTPLSLDDLDLSSAAQPRILTNKVYASFSYDLNFFCRPISLGVGASYEVSKDKNAFDQWGIWGNFETSF